VIYGSNGGVTSTGNMMSAAPITINAMDASSFQTFANNNSAAIATATNNALNSNHPLMATIKDSLSS
jgi:hypothetical protein